MMPIKKRYLYALLFGIPGFFWAGLAAITVTGTAAGFLWLFVFGDDRWPAATQTLLPATLLVAFLTVWTGTVAWGYRFGMAREDGRPVERRHLLMATGATLLPTVVILLHQFRVGNLGPKSDGERCSDLCRELGYAASGMPPRNSGDRSCICYDSKGEEILKLPLAELP